MSLQDDGSGLATFRYKTDAPGSNGAMFGGEGELGAVTHTTATGRWGFTFNDDTSITLFSPGMTTNIFLPQTAVSNFSNPLTVYFGCMPNTPENVGQMAVLDQVTIQGAGGLGILCRGDPATTHRNDQVRPDQ